MFQPKLLWQLLFEGSWPTAVTFIGGSRRLAAGNQNGQIFIWDLPEKPEEITEGDKAKERSAPSLSPLRRLDGHTNGITRLFSTPDGKQIISASLDHSIRIWPTDALAAGTATVVLDEQTRKNTARRTGKKDGLNQPGVTVETQTACQILDGHSDWVQTLAISADGKRLLSGDASSRVVLWDVENRKELRRWSGYPWNWINAAAISPDSQTAVISEVRYKRDDFDVPSAALKIWSLADGKEKLDIFKSMFPKHKPEDTSYGGSQTWRKFVAAGLIAADYSPDGKLVALGQGGETDKGQIHLLDAETGKLVRTIGGHQYGITDIRFSADGQHLFSAGRDTCVRITQVADGKEVAVLGTSRGGQFKDWISALALTADQQWIAGADIAGLVQIWSLK